MCRANCNIFTMIKRYNLLSLPHLAVPSSEFSGFFSLRQPIPAHVSAMEMHLHTEKMGSDLTGHRFFFASSLVCQGENQMGPVLLLKVI